MLSSWTAEKLFFSLPRNLANVGSIVGVINFCLIGEYFYFSILKVLVVQLFVKFWQPLLLFYSFVEPVSYTHLDVYKRQLVRRYPEYISK